MTSRKRYEQATEHLLNVLLAHKDTLKPIDWRKRSPWDEFCAVNPNAQQLAYQVNSELDYELSEFQCSWAVINVCVRTVEGNNYDLRR